MIPPPQDTRNRRDPHPDTQRLKTLIEIREYGSSDFDEYLFHARAKPKVNTELAAFRYALDQYHRSHG